MLICVPLEYDSDSLATIIVGFLAFLATIGTAWYAARSALRNARQNSVTDARLKWLIELKQLISSYLTNAISTYAQQKELAGYSKMGEEFEKRAKENNEVYDSKEFAKYVLEKRDKVLSLVTMIDTQYHLIRLNLNPKERTIEYVLRLKLIDFNNELHQYGKDGHVYIFDDDINDIIDICNQLFKVEWEKAKRGEITSFSKSQEEQFVQEFFKKYKINTPKGMTKQEIVNQIENRVSVRNHDALVQSLLSLDQLQLEWVRDVINQVNKDNKAPGNYLTAISISEDKIDLQFGSGVSLFLK